jgi:glycosyltransferase involved in cell wall biosynthesis
MEKPEYSVTVPVFNEVDCLPELVARIQVVMNAISPLWELILVDDGSSDDSFEKIRELNVAEPRIRGLQFDRNHGQTAAMAAGIRAARGEVIITLDADLQNDPADIPLLLEALHQADAAVGWRAQRNDPLIRRISSRTANWIRNLISNETIHDTGCSLKAFRAEKVQNLPFFEGMHRFLPTLVRMSGGTVVEVKVSHHPRTRGVSKYTVWNRIFKSFLDLLAIRWMKWRYLSYRIAHEI